MKKVTVFGHFGFGKELSNGQTIKTKIVSQELESALGVDQVEKVDTIGGFKALPKMLLKCRRALIESKNIVIMPAHNGVRFFAPVLLFLNRFYRRKLFYVVIGGWLPKFLKNKKFLMKKLKRFDAIFVETNSMKQALEQQGFNNVEVVPNCKELKILNTEELVYSDSKPRYVCTFSRVMKEKGIEDIVNAVSEINEKGGEVLFCLDIYGQIDKDQEQWFKTLQSNFPDFISYKGVVGFSDSVSVLKKYFALIFPTYYEGEGFAGTLLDSFASGVPVIASDWKYNSEIVRENETGILYQAKNVEDLKRALLFASDNIEMWHKCKKQCVEEAKRYIPQKVIRTIIDKLDED